MAEGSNEKVCVSGGKPVINKMQLSLLIHLKHAFTSKTCGLSKFGRFSGDRKWHYDW